MKLISTLRVPSLSFGLLHCLSAQTLHWNPTITDGSRNGDWTDGLAWNPIANGSTETNQGWPAPSIASQTNAIFSTTEGGEITLGNDVNVSGLTSGSGGRFEVISLDHSLIKEMGIFTIDVSSQGSGEFILSSDIAAPELLKLGDGTLTFNGSTEGDFSIDRGEVIFSGGNLTPSAILDILPGATATISGSLEVSTLIANGTVAGPGTLTAETIQLLDGAHIASDLKSSNIIFSGGGLVVLDGSISNEVLTIPDGTVQLSGGNLSDLTQLSTSGSGIIDLRGDQIVGTYLQVGQGSLSGPGTLNPTFGAILRGGNLAGNLSGDVEVLGDTSVSGHVSGTRTSISSGHLTVTGSLTSDLIQISPDTTFTSNGGLGASSQIENQGTITLNSDSTVARYTQEKDGLSQGNGTLTVSEEINLNGGTVATNLVGKTSVGGNILVTGSLDGPVTVTGNLNVPGSLTGESLIINGGTTTASGSIESNDINLANGTLIGSNGSLGNDSSVTAGGDTTLTLTDAHLIKNLTQSGLLNGSGSLEVRDTALLQNGAKIDLQLLGDLQTNGDVTLLPSGILDGSSLNLTSGKLASQGKITSNSIVVSDQGTLLDRATAVFSSTSNLDNSGVVEFSGNESLGALINRANGELSFAIRSSLDRDLLTVGPSGVTLEPDSVLVIRGNGLNLGQRAQIISGPINGTFSEILGTAGDHSSFRLSFDPTQGTVLALPGVIISQNQTSRLFNLNRNQTQLYGNAFDFAYVDPSSPPIHANNSSNFRRLSFQKITNPNGSITWLPATNPSVTTLSVLDLDPGSGLHPVNGDPQLTLIQRAITAIQNSYHISNHPDGSPRLDLAGNPIARVGPAGISIINQMSPEFYAGFAQVTTETLRSQLRRLDQHQIHTGKNGFVVTSDLQIGSGGSSWNFSSLSSSIQTDFNEHISAGILLGTNHGDIDSHSSRANVSGASLGLFGRYQFQDRFQTRGFASLGYLCQSFDATRNSYGGRVSANGIDATATEVSIGIESTVWDQNQLSLHPQASLRYLNGSIESFREKGDGLALDIRGLDMESFVLEAGLDARYEINEVTSLNFGLAWVHDFTSTDQSFTSSFAGRNPFQIRTDSQSASALVINVGATFQPYQNLVLNFDFRGELRDRGPDVHLWSLGGGFSF